MSTPTDGEAVERLDLHDWKDSPLLPACRLRPGQLWVDPVRGHRVMVGDATSDEAVHELCGAERFGLQIHDPPYQMGRGTASRSGSDADYPAFTRSWVSKALAVASPDMHLYVWIGADQKHHFFPLPEVITTLREFPDLESRSFITLRNQRGYGTPRNWMAVRQELLYYTRGNPPFSVTYTDIPRRLRGYYTGEASNDDRSKSPNIRPGNVWFDIQQVFYRMEENVPGAFAQKPLAALERVMHTTPDTKSVLDLFAHSGTTLLAAERTGRRCATMDINPIFAELSIRRLERFRATGKTGWQRENPFPELN